MTAHSFVTENTALFSQPAWIPVWLWQLKLLDLNDAVGLLVGLVGLLAVRQQIAFGTRPYMGYESALSAKSDGILGDQKLWAVYLKNSGSGVAIIKDQRFRIWLEGGNGSDRTFRLAYDDVIKILTENGIKYGRDHVLTNLSLGSTLASDSKFLLFEVAVDKSITVRALDVLLEFEGILGDRFQRQINLIPRSRIHLQGKELL